MPEGLDYLNDPGKPKCLEWRNDGYPGFWYSRRMAKPRHDWYFNQWLTWAGKTQADVVRELEWNKSKASLFAAGEQRYHRDDINALAAYLNLEPFELLLPPDRAMALRKYRASAEEVVALVPSPEIDDRAERRQRNGAKG